MMLKGVVCRCGGTDCKHIECKCNGFDRFRDGIHLPYPKEFVLAKNCEDEKSFPLCRYCGKVRDFPGLLVVCPNCGTKFKGPRPYFPIDFECEKCE